MNRFYLKKTLIVLFLLGLAILILFVMSFTQIKAVDASPVADIDKGLLSEVGMVDPPCMDWNLATDFMLYPDQQNPNQDSCGNPAVWHFMRSDLYRQTFLLLDSFSNSVWGIEGLQEWGTSVPGGIPVLGINATGEDQYFNGILWPAGTARAHPGYEDDTVAGWHSPIEGLISVSGGVSDNDSGGSGGISWYIDKNGVNIATGSISEGGQQYFEDGNGGGQLINIDIALGDNLYFAIDPNGDASYDSTQLDIQIHAIEIKIAGLEATNDSPTNMHETTTFTATVTAGTNITYTWDFGDGTTGVGEFTTHTYAEPRTYTAMVTASNSVGDVSADTIVQIIGGIIYLPMIIR